MSAGRIGSRYQIYPAKYFNASTTYKQWNKLTAADIHALREEPGFEGQNLYFYLNHPIRYVYLVAPIVGIEDVHPRFSIVTLDDGSGAVIDVKLERRPVPQDDEEEEQPTYPSNTLVHNVNIISCVGTFLVAIDGKEIDIGTVVKAKCSISKFRGTRQLVLKRITVIRDTNEEAKAWEALAQYKKTVLSKPWVLSQGDYDAIERQNAEEQEQAKAKRLKQRKAQAQRIERLERKMKHEERAERRRRHEEAKMNAGALV